MKVYFAGISSHKKRLEYLKNFGASKLMLTFAEKDSYRTNMKRFKDGMFDILFDSGAFSVWKRGLEINIKDYCDYLNVNRIEKYVVLDKIGDCLQTATNQQTMEDMGMSPIPVHHYGSDLKNLEKYVGKYDYICLGGTVGLKYEKRFEFFSSCFSEFPKTKFHGLGMTDLRLIKQFPFYSVDSTTWLVAEKMNRIFDENGKQVRPKEEMTAEQKFKNTIKFFVDMENLQCI